MATTYFDYTIKYGGVDKSVNTNTGLTSIVVKYGNDTKATINSATTKTLPTSGKFCNKDITIGEKTLPTSGKYCNQNISVSTTARYRWNRYSISSGWTYNRTTPTSGGYIYPNPAGSYWYAISATTEFHSVSFNSNGTFTITDTRSRRKVNRYSMGASGWAQACITANTDQGTGINSATSLQGGECMESITPHYSSGVQNGYEIWNWSWRDGNCYWHVSNSPTIVNCYYYRAYSYQSRGSYIDDVTSSNASAYPSNGVSGGYWYVAV